MRQPATDSLLNRIKKEAKQQKSPDKTYMQALDELSAKAGYADWRAIAQANGDRKGAHGDAILLDPVLPRNFDNRANEDRSTKELDQFWLRPFVLSTQEGKFEVRCLDGGCWDRSTWYGFAESLDGARQLARVKLAEWMAIMDRPVAMIRRDGLINLLQMNCRPDGQPTLYAEGLTQEEATRVLAEYNAAHPDPAP